MTNLVLDILVVSMATVAVVGELEVGTGKQSGCGDLAWDARSLVDCKQLHVCRSKQVTMASQLVGESVLDVDTENEVC
jgi:hypothetical protein